MNQDYKLQPRKNIIKNICDEAPDRYFDDSNRQTPRSLTLSLVPYKMTVSLIADFAF